ncbi:hypothetical protein INR49_022120 [Caranx melampygus]|nr:hypothetical protein INR49_022120 [Caranx melampygus]
MIGIHVRWMIAITGAISETEWRSMGQRDTAMGNQPSDYCATLPWEHSATVKITHSLLLREDSCSFWVKDHNTAKPARQVLNNVSPVPAPPHRPAGRAVVFSPEDGLTHAVLPPPVQVPPQPGRVAPQHQQDHRDGSGQHGVPQLLRDVVGVLRVLQRQVELVAPDEPHHAALSTVFRYRPTGAPEHIHMDVPSEPVVEGHACVGRRPVADDPGHEAGPGEV